ncbi:MAG: hypothetical protein ABI193_17330 [Minicystis sp.]
MSPPVVAASPAAPELAPGRPLAARAHEQLEVFKLHGSPTVDPATARAVAEASPQLAEMFGFTIDELAEFCRYTLSLEQSVKLGLFAPIEGRDDPFSRFRTS